jgi:5-(carboxyamino)imidazole ribonucleotide synthase
MERESLLNPGSTIGIIGGGQLGRMLAIAARQMDYKTIVLDPDPGCPTGQVADGQILTIYYYNLFGKYFVGATSWRP